MIIHTRERQIDIAWVYQEFAMVLLDSYPDDEMIGIYSTQDGACLFVCTFKSLKRMREIETFSNRIANNYADRRRQLKELAELAAGGNPG